MMRIRLYEQPLAFVYMSSSAPQASEAAVP